MGSTTAHTEPTLTPEQTRTLKYPNVPVKDGVVEFFAEISGIKGNFVSRFSIRKSGDDVTLENLSFQSDPLTINSKAFHATHAPLILTSGVYLTLDDYRKGRSIPLTDVTGALGV